MISGSDSHYSYSEEDKLKTCFTRQKNCVQTRRKSSMDRVTLDNSLPRVGQKWAKEQVWKVAFTLQILRYGTIFNVRLRYRAWDQRYFCASCCKNQETGPHQWFFFGGGGFGAIDVQKENTSPYPWQISLPLARLGFSRVIIIAFIARLVRRTGVRNRVCQYGLGSISYFAPWVGLNLLVLLPSTWVSAVYFTHTHRAKRKKTRMDLICWDLVRFVVSFISRTRQVT